MYRMLFNCWRKAEIERESRGGKARKRRHQKAGRLAGRQSGQSKQMSGLHIGMFYCGRDRQGRTGWNALIDVCVWPYDKLI